MDKAISIIVAMDQNNGIGKNNKLLCYLPADLKRVKHYTTGNYIIMGKNTFLSLPKGALPNRTNIVLTTDTSLKFDNCVMAHSVADALNKMSTEKENFIFGGASIYRDFLSYCSKLYITRIHRRFDADTFFPDVDFSNWKVVKKEYNPADEKNYEHTFYILKIRG